MCWFVQIFCDVNLLKDWIVTGFHLKFPDVVINSNIPPSTFGGETDPKHHTSSNIRHISTRGGNLLLSQVLIQIFGATIWSKIRLVFFSCKTIIYNDFYCNLLVCKRQIETLKYLIHVLNINPWLDGFTFTLHLPWCLNKKSNIWEFLNWNEWTELHKFNLMLFYSRSYRKINKVRWKLCFCLDAFYIYHLLSKDTKNRR